MGRGVINRLFVAVCAVAFAAATFACADGSSVGDNEGGEAPVACPLPPLALVEWAQRACALSEEAIDTLDVPGSEDPKTLTLAEGKVRAAEVLAPRAGALLQIAAKLRDVQPPQAAAGLHDALQTTIADVAAAWQDLVRAAEQADSTAELDAADAVFIQAQNEADAAVLAVFDSERTTGCAARATDGDPVLA